MLCKIRTLYKRTLTSMGRPNSYYAKTPTSITSTCPLRVLPTSLQHHKSLYWASHHRPLRRSV